MALMIGKTDLRDYVTMADEAIFLKMIRSRKDVEKGLEDSFHPEFTHQIFGPEEKIFGYKDLEVQLWYTSARLNAYLAVNCTDKIDPTKHDGVEPDDVAGLIAGKFETIQFLPTLDAFVKSLDQEASFKPIGELVKTFSIEKHNSKTNGGLTNGHSNGGDIKIASDQFSGEIQVYRADMSTPQFREYHERMQTFLWWYIEAVSYIDIDDDKWEYFVLFQKNADEYCPFTFVGYATVYRYYAYPNHERPRISQVIVLPPFQRSGVGANFLDAIYDYYLAQSVVLDITVEEPSDDFTRLRDYVDCRRAAKALDSYKADSLHGGWNEDMASEARTKLKLNKRQARRVYEILRLRATDESNEEQYRAYRVAIKSRLNAPFLKEHKDREKQKALGTLSASEVHEALMPREERLKLLDKMYQQLETEYRHTIERLALDN